MSHSTVLIIETSTPQASLCIVRKDGTIESRSFHSERSHNSALFEPLRELLAGVPAIDLVLVGSGPGSYSGTRVGIAAAQGVAIAMGCPAIALPSVLAVEEAASGASCLAVGDARRGSYWSARLKGPVMQEPVLQPMEAWQQTLRKAAADGCALFSFEDPSRWPLPPGVEIRLSHPAAVRLWHAWNAADPSTRAAWLAQPPQPIYLKPPHITKSTKPQFIPSV